MRIAATILILTAAAALASPWQMVIARKKANAGAETPPPLFENLAEWWDAADTNYIAMSAGLVDSWTGKVASTVLTGTTTTRPTHMFVEGVPYVSFDLDYLDMPSGFTIDRRDCAVFVVARTRRADTTARALFHMGVSSTTFALYYQAQEARAFTTTARFTGYKHGTGMATIFMSASATNTWVGLGPQKQSYAAAATGTIADGYVGQWNGGAFKNVGDIQAVMVYDRALTAAECEDVVDWAGVTYGVENSGNTCSIFYEGDSLTQGVGSTSDKWWSYPDRVARLCTPPPRYENSGAGGSLASSVTGATAAIAWFGASAVHTNKTVIYWYGSNDINGGDTATNINSSIASFITNLKSSHADAHIVGMTILDRTDFDSSEDSVRAAVNDYIVNNAAFDSLINIATNEFLDDPASATYFADGVHPTDAGYAVVSELVYDHLTAEGRLP